MNNISFHNVVEVDIRNRLHKTFSVSALRIKDKNGQVMEINLFNSGNPKPLIKSVNGKRITEDRKVVNK